MSKEVKYTEPELLACTASRILENKKSVFVGTGLPMIASMLAQKTHAPELLIVFEAGGLGPQMPVLPISVGDSRTFHRAVAASSMHDVMSVSQAGYIDFGFLGAAQIDPYGNINTTIIGPYEEHKTRLPGSGGANDVGSFSQRTIIILRQDKRKFVEKVDFITTPGFLTGPGAREAAGLPKNTGPYRVITQLGVYGFHPDTKRMMLLSLHRGVTLEDVKANSSFEIGVADRIEVTEPPSEHEVRLLHEEIDPVGIVLRK
jgi:acyl CoA:acetate/3-ketoacid CoA transferase beta subunit